MCNLKTWNGRRTIKENSCKIFSAKCKHAAKKLYHNLSGTTNWAFGQINKFWYEMRADVKERC